MSPKTIFKVLLGTIVIIVVSCCIIELMNVNLNSIRLNTLTRMAANNAAELFGQETYKSDGTNGSADMPNIIMPAGISDSGVPYSSADYISGAFYKAPTAGENWIELYTTPEFKHFCATYQSKWKSLSLINMALTQNLDSVAVPGIGASDNQIQEYADKMVAKAFKSNYYTPLNIGVPYLDKNTVEKIFRWNLTQLLSNCNNELIMKDENGKNYVLYSGFRCYTNEARITNITYKVYNMDNASQKAEFQKLTSINPDRFTFDDSSALEMLGTATDERKNICIAFIEYSLPVSYKGITPIASVYEYVWNTEVDGFDGAGRNGPTSGSLNSNIQTLNGGGIGDNTLPTSGQLIYYLVR